MGASSIVPVSGSKFRIIEGATSIIEGATSTIEGATSIIEGATSIIEGATSGAVMDGSV